MKYSVPKNNFKKNLYYGSILSKGSGNLYNVFLKYKDKIDLEVMKELVDDLQDTALKLLSEGYSVNFGSLFTLEPVIKGKFVGPDDSFDPGRHSIHVVAEAGSAVKKFINSQEIKLKKIENEKHIF